MPPQNPENPTPATGPTTAPVSPPQETAPAPNPVSVVSEAAAQATMAMDPAPKSSGSKLWMILIGVIVFLLIIGGGLLYYLNTQQKTSESTAVPETSAAPISKVEDLNQELGAATPAEVEPDFQSTDKDLQSL